MFSVLNFGLNAYKSIWIRHIKIVSLNLSWKIISSDIISASVLLQKKKKKLLSEYSTETMKQNKEH